MATITGTDDPETLNGTEGDDIINGLGGDDIIYALGGNDSAYGGNGDDTINGGEGDDTLHGEGGDDIVNGGENNDTLYGEDGYDRLIGGEGDDAMIGGDGDDILGDYYFWGYSSGLDSYSGGDGNDTIYAIRSDGFDQGTVDGGADNDSIYFSTRDGYSALLTGGTGKDTYYPQGVATTGDTGVIITDFTPGDTGDVIKLDNVLLYLTGLGTSNPFGSGFMRVVQSDNDTLLQADADGADNGAQFYTLITLKDVTATNLTKANFEQFSPDGSISIINGTPNDDPNINGTNFDDIINGLGGNDIVYGNAGNDTITTFDGNDQVYGQEGNDTINGLGGDDYIDGGSGNDTLDGGEGNDQIDGGGAGDDTLIGGAGNDTLSDGYWWWGSGSGLNSYSGGDGDDAIYAYRNDGGFDQGTVDGGADNDSIYFSTRDGYSALLTGGTGKDTYYPNGVATTADTGVVITDFTPGDAGDVIKLDNLLPYLTGSIGDNPFASGHLRVVQNGDDTLLQADYDSADNGQSFHTLITLQNVTITSLMAENFGGYEPLTAGYVLGGAGDDSLTDDPGVHTFVGRGGNDKYYVDDQADKVIELFDQGMDEVYASVSYILADNLENLVLTGTATNGTGNAGNNFLKGNDGNNVLEGGEGDDALYGGLGRDTASYEHALNVVTVNLNLAGRQNTGAGNDLLNSIENLLGSKYNDTLKGNSGDNVLDGGEGDDVLDGGAGADNLIGGVGSDTASYASATSGVTVDLNITVRQQTGGGGFEYLSGIENLIGSGHNDTLKGKAGDSVLTGGLGGDQFIFMAPRKGIDQLKDFSHAQGDKLVFASSDYGFGPGHGLVGRELVIDGQANGTGPQLLYSSGAHTLSWDPDGKGGVAAIKIAILDGVNSLSADDFLFV